jgi:uncharacterized surface protein with fasciclin (FAS1) repeats
MPATPTITAQVVAGANLTLLESAVIRANLQDTLQSQGPFTVFAPTNAAFIAAGFPDVAAINAAAPNTLASILTYHVVPGRVFSSDLVNATTPATANGGTTVTIGVTAHQEQRSGEGQIQPHLISLPWG